MADLCLLVLIFLSPLFTGSTGEETRVFSSPGENVILPCNNALSDCTSTTWIYSKNDHIAAVDLFAKGQKKNDRERSERLSLGSDCSLNIYKTTEEDHGQYTCQQYVKGQRHGNDASVYLTVLKVSSSSTQTEMRPGRSLTLSCRLFSYESCDTLVRIEGVQLVWVNQSGVNLQNDSRYYISSSSGQCISTLTTTLLNEDNNREWRCLIIKNNEIKTSDRYTVRFMDPSVTTTNSDTTSTTNASETEGCKTCVSLFRVIIVIVEISVFAAPTVILLQIICAGRAENKRAQTI